MKEFEKKLNEEQIKQLEEIRPDFREMDTEELWNWLIEYEQENGINDIDTREDLQKLEIIIDILADY